MSSGYITLQILIGDFVGVSRVRQCKCIRYDALREIPERVGSIVLGYKVQHGAAI